MKITKNRRKIWRILPVVLTGIFIVAAISVVLLSNISKTPPTKKVESVKQQLQPQPTGISSDVVFFGNIYWGRYINDWSMASQLKYAYPFSRLNEFQRDKYDAWVAGLECPIVAGVSMTSAEEDSTLTFNCSPDYLPEAAKWFTAVTLANNHTDNQGVDGFSETRQHLDDNGIQYFGHYDPRAIGDNCEVIALPVTVSNDDNTTEKGKLPVAMCGYHGVFRIPDEDAVAEMQKYSQYIPVIAMPHMGAEYKASPDELKVNFYRELIDNGADMVLGDHPHWIQGTESYNGHLIVYSMGNFIFDQQDTSEVVRSAGIRVKMDAAGIESSVIKKWLSIGDKCAAFHDDCLNQIKQQGLNKLNIEYKFGVIGTNDSGKIAKPATDIQQTEILNRLDWQSTMNKLQSPYSSL